MTLRRRAAVGVMTALCLVGEAGAVVTVTTGYFGVRTLTLRIGTAAAGSVDTVQFNVGAAPFGNSGPAAASVNGNGTAIAASGGGVVARMFMQVPGVNIPQQMTTTVTSPAALTCVSGGCGGATIPFSAISWTVSPAPSGPNATVDWQSGSFVGGSTQQLLNFFLTNAAGTAEVNSVLNFSYANTTAYPAGSYSGRVVYTTTLP